MASEHAKAVAQEVIEKARKGEKINKQEIQMKHGYSKTSAKSMKATITKTYKKTMKPIIKSLITERDRAIEEMKKKRKDAKYRDLSDAVDKLTKVIQLLSGRATDRTEIFTQEQIDAILNRRTKKDSTSR